MVRSERGVDISVHTNKKAYDPGEQVLIHIQLTNYGFKTVKLVYGSSIVLEFIIYNSDDQVVFQAPRVGLCVITEVTLGPGEIRDFKYSWNQVNETDEQAGVPDTFTVRALSPSYGHLFSASTKFSISA